MKKTLYTGDGEGNEGMGLHTHTQNLCGVQSHQKGARQQPCALSKQQLQCVQLYKSKK